jgi:hypothetical protein
MLDKQYREYGDAEPADSDASDPPLWQVPPEIKRVIPGTLTKVHLNQAHVT